MKKDHPLQLVVAMGATIEELRDELTDALSSYLVPMTTLIVGIISALVGVLGVGTGAWLQGRDNHRRWLRDQKLQAAVDFITTTGDAYDNRLLGPSGDDEATELLRRAQKSRSALYLLCDDHTVEMAEALIQAVRHFECTVDGSAEAVIISMLKELVQQLRSELSTGDGRGFSWNRKLISSET